ncbi:MAG TPA: anti-sigma factor [Candidatus Acidoferrum sp.]
MSNADQFRELIEAYALGTLDAQERAALETHLATGCAECATALQEARWLTSQLAYLAPTEQPSDMLRGRLLQAVRADQSNARQPANTSTSIPVPYWLWAAVAALLILTTYSAWDSRRLQREIQATNQRASDEIAKRHALEQELTVAKLQAHEALILSDPASIKISLPCKNPAMPKLEAVWHPTMGIVVTGWKIPMPSNHRVFQLWLIPKTPGGKPMPSEMAWPNAEGKLVFMVANPPDVPGGTQALAVTEEPAGGSSQPTSTPIWVSASK